MNIEQAENIVFLLESIKTYKKTNDRIVRLFKEAKHEEIASIALEMSSELQRIYEQKLSEYPPNNNQ